MALLGQRLADRGQLHRDLGVPGQPARARAPEHVEVRRDGRVRLVGVEGVLAEEVEGDPEVVADQARRSRRTASAVASPGT